MLSFVVSEAFDISLTLLAVIVVPVLIQFGSRNLRPLGDLGQAHNDNPGDSVDRQTDLEVDANQRPS